jgi:hypothetical protein
MGDLQNLIEAVKQGNLDGVRAILQTNDQLLYQRDESGG